MVIFAPAVVASMLVVESNEASAESFPNDNTTSLDELFCTVIVARIPFPENGAPSLAPTANRILPLEVVIGVSMTGKSVPYDTVRTFTVVGVYTRSTYAAVIGRVMLSIRTCTVVFSSFATARLVVTSCSDGPVKLAFDRIS